MHADQATHVKRRNDGEVPKSWLTGDTPYQKAAVIAAVAWSAVKPPEDPELIACDLSFRENCIGIVEGIMRDGAPDANNPFALKAAELWKQTADYTDRHPNLDTRLTTTAKETAHD